MRIGMVVKHCCEQQSSKIHIELARRFIQRGHDVEIFSSKWDAFDKRVKFHKIPTISSNFFSCLPAPIFNTFPSIFAIY